MVALQLLTEGNLVTQINYVSVRQALCCECSSLSIYNLLNDQNYNHGSLPSQEYKAFSINSLNALPYMSYQVITSQTPMPFYKLEKYVLKCIMKLLTIKIHSPTFNEFCWKL